MKESGIDVSMLWIALGEQTSIITVPKQTLIWRKELSKPLHMLDVRRRQRCCGQVPGLICGVAIARAVVEKRGVFPVASMSMPP